MSTFQLPSTDMACHGAMCHLHSTMPGVSRTQHYYGIEYMCQRRKTAEYVSKSSTALVGSLQVAVCSVQCVVRAVESTLRVVPALSYGLAITQYYTRTTIIVLYYFIQSL